MTPIVPIENSASVKGIGYDPATRTLVVRLPGDMLYEYPDVPEEDHAAFMAAESKGKHFSVVIKAKYVGTLA